MPRRNNRAPQPELPVILPSFTGSTPGTWVIEMTNGSGVKRIETTGTRLSAWNWAAEAGVRGGIADGYWWPFGITRAANVVSTEPFVAVV